MSPREIENNNLCIFGVGGGRANKDIMGDVEIINTFHLTGTEHLTIYFTDSPKKIEKKKKKRMIDNNKLSTCFEPLKRLQQFYH